MPYISGDTYVWTDNNGAVHVWGKQDASLINSLWMLAHTQEQESAGVVIPVAVWNVIKESIIKDVCGNTAKRILVGEHYDGTESEKRR